MREEERNRERKRKTNHVCYVSFSSELEDILISKSF